MTLRVLVVEDEPEMSALIARGLRGEGYAVDIAANGIDAITLAAEAPYDVAVLDVMLPGMSGFELCRRMRDDAQASAIVLLTARDAVDDRVRGLDAGADDYLTKPFAFAELAARLRAVRRREISGSTRIEIGDLVIDLPGHRIYVGDRESTLSRTEFDLLHLLTQNVDRVLPRAAILDAIWGSASYIDPNIVDQYVSYVRRKLAAAGSSTRIVTARGVGFQLSAAS